jgi:galactokinase
VTDGLLLRCLEALGPSEDDSSVTACFVPGRVELLGKHTDYAGGSSLVLALERGFRMTARPRPDRRIRMIPADRPAQAEVFTLDEPPDRPPGHWLHYPAVTLERILRNFGGECIPTGAEVAFLSNIPVAAGMSSSSAFMTATFLTFARLWTLEETPAWRANLPGCEQRAAYLGSIENGSTFGSLSGSGGVGTFGGSEDHAAMLCSEEGRIGLFRYDPLQLLHRIDWPEDHLLAIFDSGVPADKTGTRREAYNRASLRARMAVETFNAAAGTAYHSLGGVADGACGQGPGDVLATLARREREDPALDGLRLAARFDQFYHEDRIWLPSAAAALERGDLDGLGSICDASHQAATPGLENATPQTDMLQRSARELGALAASGFGAGFGGSVWALIPSAAAGDFGVRWQNDYRRAFPAEAARGHLLFTRPGPPARSLFIADPIRT